MKVFTKIARPYAKAAFEFATLNGTLDQWKEFLDNVTLITTDSQFIVYVGYPKITDNQIIALFAEILGADSFDKHHKNFLLLLAENKRLHVLPTIKEIFSALCAKNRADVTVITTLPLTSAQHNALKLALKKKFQRQYVVLHEEINPELLGGAILHTSNFAIDGSGRGKLTRLNDYLKRQSLCN